MRRPSAALVVAFLALLLSLGGVSFAAIPARDGDIHACYSKKTGAIELIDTQRDRFSCERNWNGIAIDTTPARLLPPNVTFNPRTTQSVVEAAPTGPRLASPNGKFSIEVENDGIKLVGPNAVLTLGESSVDIAGNTAVTVTGGATVSVTGGNAINMLAGKTMSLGSGEDMTLNATRNATLSATDVAKLTSRRTEVAGLNSLLLTAPDMTINSSGNLDMRASGATDVRGSVVRINGTIQSGD
jgi:hypothetical protein